PPVTSATRPARSTARLTGRPRAPVRSPPRTEPPSAGEGVRAPRGGQPPLVVSAPRDPTWPRTVPPGLRSTPDLTHHQIRSRMPTTRTIHPDGVAEVVMDNPPVNALTVAGWFELADLITGLGRDEGVRAVVLRAEGRGFNAGVDIK